MRAGFTLVEVMVAVAIAAFLILAVAAATQFAVVSAGRQKNESRQAEVRARAIELLRQDWRDRTKIVTPAQPPPAGTRVLQLATASDSVSSPRRSAGLVTYAASEKGLLRSERESDSWILPGPVIMEFWDGVAWRPQPAGAQPTLRLLLATPAETVVLR